MKSLTKNIIIAVAVFLVIAGVFSLLNTPESRESISLSELIKEIKTKQIKSLIIAKDNVEVDLLNGQKKQTFKEEGVSLTETLVDLGVTPEELTAVGLEVKSLAGLDFVVGTLLPILLPFLLIAGFFFFTFRSAQNVNRRAISFGNTRLSDKPDKTKSSERQRITFKDVAGSREAKEELSEIVEFLRNPQKFTRLGARIPHGVLLFGPPGVGKTMLAKAVSGEANVPFFHISASEFVELFVGVGASRVRDLFNKAKKVSPSIVFIDEIDAIGRQRGAGLGGSHDEREQTLNQILVELDGFESDENTIVIAATNRPDVLDPALLRPGRFDRRVILTLPDIKERAEILKSHSRNKPLLKAVDLREIAQRTPGFSGADLANVLNEAAILAARMGLKAIDRKQALSAIEKVLLGPERKSHLLSQREKKITAYHESGHAVIAHILPYSDPVHKISIISRGQVAGYTLKLPIEDRRLHSKKEFLDDLCVLLAGFLTEKKIFKDLTTGASNDLREATRLVRSLVTEYGMSKRLGPVTFGEKEEMIFLSRTLSEQHNYSEKTAAVIDDEINHFISRAVAKTEKLLNQLSPKLKLIAKTLMEKETLEKEEFEKLMA